MCSAFIPTGSASAALRFSDWFVYGLTAERRPNARPNSRVEVAVRLGLPVR